MRKIYPTNNLASIFLLYMCTLAFFCTQNLHIINRITIPLKHTTLRKVAVAMIAEVEIDKKYVQHERNFFHDVEEYTRYLPTLPSIAIVSRCVIVSPALLQLLLVLLVGVGYTIFVMVIVGLFAGSWFPLSFLPSYDLYTKR